MKNFIQITIILTLLTSSIFTVSAENIDLKRIDPPSWWVGMKNPTLQLMVYGENISLTTPKIDYPGVELIGVVSVENPNYLFLHLEISESAVSGTFSIQFLNKKKIAASYDFILNERKKDPALFKGFDNSDVIYLLMPDRFANADPDNDNVKGMLEKADRSDPLGRHGGDILGIANNLDYLSNLGTTAVWINPLLENNMPARSYHGYAITDFYKTDPRFGTNEDYRKLVEQAHQKGLKIIMDMVFNHCGTGYYWNDDLPSKDWYNQWPEFTRSNYRGETVSDPYASEADSHKMVAGWFDVTMADLNQENPLLAEFLIQNSIWWIEYLGLDAIRQDTYPYPDKNFMAKWMKRLLDEYPDYNVVGEVWLNHPGLVAYWMQNTTNADGFQSNLTNVFDFPLMGAINQAFNEKDGWDKGTARLYEILSRDFLYSNPMDIVVFLDNHDGDRFFTKMNEDFNKFKMGLVFLLTTRGIPQLYYGGEILMTGKERDGHGAIRENFPGGWPGDKINGFTGDGLSDEQLEAQQFTRRLLNWRINNPVVQFGELTHYIPENGVYVYFRHNDNGSVMILLNNNDKETIVNLARFSENLTGYTKGQSVLGREYFEVLNEITIPAKSPMIIELIR